MHPILFHSVVFGHDLFIGTYGVITVAALAAGIAVFALSGKRMGFSIGDSIDFSLIISVSSMIGAASIGLLLFFPERISYGFFIFPPVLVSWGGIIGGISAVLIISKKWNVDFLKLADISGPAFLTGIGIGRIGCFFGGCCFGIHSDFFKTVIFTHPLAPASIMVQPLIPVQLISSFFLITAGIIFLQIHKYLKTNGLICASILIYYSLFRFVIEFLRADSRKFLFGYSDAQIFSLFFFLTGLCIFVYIFKIKSVNNGIK